MKTSSIPLMIFGAISALTAAVPASASVSVEGRADGDPYTLLGSGPIAATYTGPVGAFTLTATAALSLPVGTLAKLSSTLLAARVDTAAHSLDILATVTDVTAGNFEVLSGFTQNASPGWTVTEETYIDPTNTAFGLGTLIDSRTYGVLGAELSTSGPMSLTDMFSITHVYHLSVDALALGSSLSTVSASLLPAAVPEPGSWALMLTGFGLAGLMMRSRRGLQAGPSGLS